MMLLLFIWVIMALGTAAAAASPPLSPEPVPSATTGTIPLATEKTVGPAELKKQSRLMVETNVPPAVIQAVDSTNAPPKAFDWQVSWKGWKGLHVGLTRKTWLGERLADAVPVPVLRFEETRMTAKIGAKVALDAAAFLTDDDLTGFDDGVELRRVRIYARGDCLLLLPVSYEVEVGYIPDQFYIENSFLQFHNLGIFGSLKGGQFQAPMSMDNYGSSRDMMFMEPAAVLQAIAPGVNAGLQIGRPVLSNRMTWAAGLFTDSFGNDIGDATDGFGRVVGRVTGLPIYDRDAAHPESQRLLHLGLSGSVLWTSDSTVRYRSRPESHLAPYVVDTGEIIGDGSAVVGAELAWINGPLCVQTEYLHSSVRDGSERDVNFGGAHVSASWFLTGESRPYDLAQGTFARVVPRRNFDFGKGGWGAWEIAGRYSFVNLNSESITGGRLAMISLGVNWYLHAHVKWRFDYAFGQVSGRQPDGNLSIFQTRLELDF